MKNRQEVRPVELRFDVLLTCLTGGLWLIWIFVREMRKR